MTHHASPGWLEDQFLRWQKDPGTVPADLAAFFSGFELGGQNTADPGSGYLEKLSAVQSLLYRYRDIGHLQACTNPLEPCPVPHPELRLEAFGLGPDDLQTVFTTNRYHQPETPLNELLNTMHNTYCRSIGVEYMHIQNPAERSWLKERMEPTQNHVQHPPEERLRILYKLQEAALFEQFLHRQFLGQKRFSLEGGEVLISLLEHLTNLAGTAGMHDLMLGMAHRGRLNVLANIFQKPLANIFAEFADNIELGFVGEGDVKYHKGHSVDREFPGGHRLHLSIAANPSHLEAVDPVVLGKCRSRHSNYGPGGKQLVLPILIHGDAAFAGQGMVAETLNLSQLDGYQVGGTLHLVVNNQIGFTTAPAQARSTPYATDVAKMLMVPIFHVHGEDPEAAMVAAEHAFAYRQKFAKDAIIEVICYRRQGHNEGDEPAFTQPLMYSKIRRRPPVHEAYAEQLIGDGIDAHQIAVQEQEILGKLEAAKAGGPVEQEKGYLGKWHNVQREFRNTDLNTGVDGKTLQRLATAVTKLPPHFQPHPKVAKLLQKRRETVLQGHDIDWGTGETLAYASLVTEGVPVRLSGEDCRRGTFNHRHAVMVDQQNGQLAMPLALLAKGQATMQVYDSMLSENAVLGFEFGYSLDMPEGLTLWEAQFGDFANGAQVIIDQFISSSGTKWDRTSGLTLFLPHGYEGQGAEHSSARIERYLQLCADNNMLIVYPSSPAQLFHLLRRQAKVPWRRPLVVFTPKSLLRHPACRSRLNDFCHGPFQEVIGDSAASERARTLLLCSGKLYYELAARRAADKREDVAILRLEQLYPLREEKLIAELRRYPKLKSLAWVQEEPANCGAWLFVQPELQRISGRELLYIGRPAMAAAATGSHRQHNVEQNKLISRAFSI